MYRETRSQNQNRKRPIVPNNLNQSVEVESKKPKYTNTKSKMATDNGSFRDLSASINTRSEPVPSPMNPSSSRVIDSVAEQQVSTPSATIAPELRELVVDETVLVQRALEERVKRMVQDEMSDIRRSVGELAKAVKELAVGCSRSLENNNNSQQNVYNRINETNNWNRNSEFPTDYRIVSQNRQMDFANGVVFPRSYGNDANVLPMANHGPNRGLGAENADPVAGSRNTPESRVTPETLNRNPERMSIRVDKWGLIFDGNNAHMSVEDFIFRIEHLQAHYRISWDEILRDFHLMVTGPAKDWYWLVIRTHGIMPWPTFRNELLNQYRTHVSNFEIMRDLVERKQQSHESLDVFFHSMCKLRSRLVQPIPEYDMIKIIKRNVKESVARIVYPIAVSSVEQLRIECLEAERNFPRRETRTFVPPQRVSRNISEVHYPEEDDIEVVNEEVAAIKIMQNKPQIICWNCKLQGHGFRDCNSAERTLFCYRCGKPNVIAPKCPDCQQGNRLRDAGLTGDQRPSKNPAEK